MHTILFVPQAEPSESILMPESRHLFAPVLVLRERHLSTLAFLQTSRCVKSSNRELSNAQGYEVVLPTATCPFSASRKENSLWAGAEQPWLLLVTEDLAKHE